MQTTERHPPTVTWTPGPSSFEAAVRDVARRGEGKRMSFRRGGATMGGSMRWIRVPLAFLAVVIGFGVSRASAARGNDEPPKQEKAREPAGKDDAASRGT